MVTVTDAASHSVTQQAADQRPDLHLISRKEASQRLGISTRTLDEMVKRGDLRAVKVSARTLIPITELERMVAPAAHALSYAEARQADTPEV